MHKQNNQLIHPLSPENINNIVTLCSKFIQERYNVSLAKSTLYEILTNIYKKNLQYFRNNPPLPPLDELNKMAISEVRNFIIEQQKIEQQKIEQQKQEYNTQHHVNNFQPPPHPQVQIHTQTKYPSMNQSPLLQQPNSKVEDYHNIQVQQSYINEELQDHSELSDISIRQEKDEDNFFKKLQTLELQRGEQINIKEPTSDPLPVGNQQKIQAAPPQSTNTIIYMSNPSVSADTRNIKPIVLSGASRMWIHVPDRNLFIFNGPLPDSVHIRLSKILLPKRVSNITPCINVHIKSAIDKTVDILCCIDKEGPVWDIWKPVSNILSLIKTFSCPWTIILNDLFNKPLEMGKDANKIISVTRLMNGNTKITVEPDCDINSFGQILIKNEDETEIHTNILHVIKNTIELPGDYSHIQVNNSYICNLQAQAYIIFEMEKQDENLEN